MDLTIVDHCQVREAVKRRRGRDPEKVKANHRAYYERKKAAGIDPSRSWKSRNRDKVNAYKRKRRADRAKPRRERDLYRSVIVMNARDAWRYWIKVKAPDWWMRAYYREIGKPWANPRLTDAQQWKIRYWCDPAFRAREIEKVQVLKERRAQRIAATCDGTLTGEVIVALFASTTHCRYCGELMRSVQKSLDHKTPLSVGGAHSIHNVVVCCKTCNTLKADRTIDEWIAALMQRRAARVDGAVRVLPRAA